MTVLWTGTLSRGEPLRLGQGRPLWAMGSIAVAAAAAIPLATVLWTALTPDLDLWRHLASSVLWRYLEGTLWLGAGTAVGTAVIGTGCAWLVTMCRFPGRRILDFALLLPFAVPTYVIAYVYTDLLEYAGPVQGALRATAGWESARDYWFPEIRSLGGAIALFSLVLYPYVYLVTRAAFVMQSTGMLEAGRMLGQSAGSIFRRIGLPMARPAIAAGVLLALMETLNDFGAVEFFAVPTLTTGIFDVWLGLNNLAGAAQLACIPLIVIVVLLVFERLARGGRQFQSARVRFRSIVPYELRGVRAAGATLACLAPVSFGFGIPAGILVTYAATHIEEALASGFVGLALNSIGLSISAAVLSVIAVTLLVCGIRFHGGRIMHAVSRLAVLGYAIPGAVLAVGAIIALTTFENALDDFARSTFGFSTGLLVTGTVLAVIVGYVVRFLAVSFGTVEASSAKITPSMDDAARNLGLTPLIVFWRIHVRLMAPGFIVAGLLVFVECMKELPMTLLLRPFNFETLATFVYQRASDELLEESAAAALAIVLAGIVPVIVGSLAVAGSRPGTQFGARAESN